VRWCGDGSCESCHLQPRARHKLRLLAREAAGGLKRQEKRPGRPKLAGAVPPRPNRPPDGSVRASGAMSLPFYRGSQWMKGQSREQASVAMGRCAGGGRGRRRRVVAGSGVGQAARTAPAPTARIDLFLQQPSHSILGNERRRNRQAPRLAIFTDRHPFQPRPRRPHLVALRAGRSGRWILPAGYDLPRARSLPGPSRF